TREGIVFASRKPGNLLAIESDPFLLNALESDTIQHRIFEFQERNVLELVRPFATDRYPFGLFRVGLSLEGYYAVSNGFNKQMAVMSGVLFSLMVVAILYLNSKKKRREISREYTRMKTLTDKIFEQMKIGVGAIDSEGVVRLANEAFERIFTLQGSEGKKWAEICPPGISLETFLAGRTEADEIEAALEVAGITREVLIARSKISSESDRQPSVVMVAYDITRLKEYERKSARKERLSEMGNLAAGVAHEIRNPLNTISIAAQRLAAEFTPETNRAEYISFTEKIKSETRRLNDIITRFLALAREHGHDKAAVSLDRIIDEFAGFIKAEATSLGIEIEISCEPDLRIRADADALRQVLQNLYNNTKEAFDGRAGKITITGNRQGDNLVMTFSDNGPGIDSKIRDKIFTPYFTTKDAGTGLGLPTVFKIISDLGGDVRIEDAAGDGVVFKFVLPAEK
ncbi:MAG: two-component system sensor histidine kinase NtrB, partial [Candidatus Zixiibacteriota bacterium]